MIRNFWFAPDVCAEMTNYEETLHTCMNSVTQFMQDEARRHGTLTTDLNDFDNTVIRVTIEAIAFNNPHLRQIITVRVNRQDEQELGDVEVRLAATFYNIIQSNPGVNQTH